MPLNTEVDYNNVVIKGTVELGVKGERGLQGFKGDQGIQGPPVPVAHELGDDPSLAVSQKLLTDSIADMEQGNEAAVLEATHQAGLAGDSAVIATGQAGIAASRADEAAQSAQAASASALDAGQHANTATEQADIAEIKAGEASSSASDAASSAGLAADSETAAEQAATIATNKADEASQSAQAAAQSATQAEEALDDKVDKAAGKQLSDENYTLAEKDKLGGIAEQATKNRADSENADKVHEHVIADVAGLDAALLTKFDKADIAQTAGTAADKVMSQKAVTDLITDMTSSYIPNPKPTPPSFGTPFEGGFYMGMIWNRIALSTESKTLVTGLIEFKIDRSAAIVYKGQSLEIRSIANPSNKFIGTVVGAYPRSIILNISSISGSGTYSDWAVMSRFRNIVAPKSQGETSAVLKFENTPMPEATQTVTEGWAATNSMLAGGTDTQYPAAHWARALNINGYTDWYIPARDELELMWRNLKPQAIDNYIVARYASPIDYKKDGAYPDSVMTQGTNLNSIPAGAAYTALLPAQTDALAFRAGGPEEFLWNQYFWSSSEASAAYAWNQYWGASYPGGQGNYGKATLRRVRAMRRSII